MEYTTLVTWSTGSGIFGDLILSASELEIYESPNIAINEFFFRNASGTSVPDYVELSNFGDSDVDVTGWTLMGEELSGNISAGGHVVVAGEDPFFNEDGDEFYAGDDLPNSMYADISLSTSSDEIDLLDASGSEIDYVAYGDGWPVGNDNRGHSVELLNPTLDNADVSSWVSVDASCVSDYLYGEDGSDEDVSNFGSPGFENCNYDESLDIEEYIFPTDYSLLNAYPNPFNPSTTINYSIPVTGMVKINVFDMLGRELALLSNEMMQPGYYSITWNASDYPSGMYLITLQSDKYFATQKVTLIK